MNALVIPEKHFFILGHIQDVNLYRTSSGYTPANLLSAKDSEFAHV